MPYCKQKSNYIIIYNARTYAKKACFSRNSCKQIFTIGVKGSEIPSGAVYLLFSLPRRTPHSRSRVMSEAVFLPTMIFTCRRAM